MLDIFFEEQGELMREPAHEVIITRDELVSVLAEVTRDGWTVAQTDRAGSIQFAAVNPDKQGALFEVAFPSYHGNRIEVKDGLRMTGVIRRFGVMRKFVECKPLDISKGDKIIFEDATGETTKSNKVKRILPRIR